MGGCCGCAGGEWGGKGMRMRESLAEKIRRVTAEEIDLALYDPRWPQLFCAEEARWRAWFPGRLGRIAHFGSTAVPGLCAKPVVDMLIETTDPAWVRAQAAPFLEDQGYDYFWRPSFGDDVPPWYSWLIRRDDAGKRTHHIHVVEPDFEHWRRLHFRDYLIARPDIAAEYGRLKTELAAAYAGDRVAYTRAKTDFILRTTAAAVAWAADRDEG